MQTGADPAGRRRAYGSICLIGSDHKNNVHVYVHMYVT
jgi:hypothetical protein